MGVWIRSPREGPGCLGPNYPALNIACFRPCGISHYLWISVSLIPKRGIHLTPSGLLCRAIDSGEDTKLLEKTELDKLIILVVWWALEILLVMFWEQTIQQTSRKNNYIYLCDPVTSSVLNNFPTLSASDSELPWIWEWVEDTCYSLCPKGTPLLTGEV